METRIFRAASPAMALQASDAAPMPGLVVSSVERAAIKPILISGVHKQWIFFLIHLNLLWTAMREYINPFLVIKALMAMEQLRKKFLGDVKINRMVKVEGRYYWDLYTPGWRWNSPLFNDYLAAELNRLVPMARKTNRFLNIFFAITKKCPLRCEHCFEWDALNGKEKLALADVKEIVSKFQEQGLSQVQFTGGEPMVRVKDLLEVLAAAPRTAEYWVLTSGFNVTKENASALKAAGLTGMVVSIDHVDPAQHNAFRGHDRSFEMAQQAVRNARAANLVTALSLCVTRSFVTESNLSRYAEMAKDMGVAFIQILEPKSVGRYKGMDVALGEEHEQILSDFFVKLNSEDRYAGYPIVCYHGYYQRRMGCLAAGNRSLYIDTDGDLHSCPFSSAKRGTALGGDLELQLRRLRDTGCHSFTTFST